MDKTLFDEILAIVRDLSPDWGFEVKSIVSDIGKELRFGVAFKREIIFNQEICEHTKTPNIHFLPVIPILHNLRRHIIRSPQEVR